MTANGRARSKSEETLSEAMRLFQSMADKLSKQPENVPGVWYVDMSCALLPIHSMRARVAAVETVDAMLTS